MILVLESDSWLKEDIEKILLETGLEISNFASDLRHPILPTEVNVVICGLGGRSFEDGIPTWDNVKIVYYATPIGVAGCNKYFQLPRGVKWSPAEWWQKELKEKVLEAIEKLT